MNRLPPSVRRFLDLEADIEDDDEERNSEEEEEQALRSASSFLLHIKYHITNYILQIISFYRSVRPPTSCNLEQSCEDSMKKHV